MKKLDHPSRLAAVDQARIKSLVPRLKSMLAQAIYIDYAQAERDCQRLAAKIMDIYSRNELQKFRFIPIPRGGYIVLGMLAYALGLKAENFAAPNESDPVFIVDDCALTGARFHQTISQVADHQVVFAHLYSHPDLRQAILDREAKVQRCVAAHDLVDRAREYYKADAEYETWQKRCRDRLGLTRYWLGMTDPIAFAWSEPDAPFWNPENETLEDGWRSLPPQLCLKNRYRLGPPLKDATTTPWRLAPGLVMGHFDDVIWLVNPATEQVYSVSESGADMLRAILLHDTIDAAAEYLANAYDLGRSDLTHDLSNFIEKLEHCGLLESSGTHE